MNKVRAALLSAAVAIVALLSVTASASASPAINWKANTCEAFSHWEHSRTTANLDRMATYSLHVPWRYVGEDAWGLTGDIRSGAPAKYVKADIRYFTQDCSS